MSLITKIGDSLEVGTRIHWDEKTQNLYYVDVPQSQIYRYKPSSSLITTAKVGTEPLAFAFPVEGSDDQFIAGVGRKIVILQWDGVGESVCSCTTVAEVDRQPKNENNRLNGAKVDPFGRLWAGTMGPQDSNGLTEPGRGSLYSVSQGKLKRHFSDVGISNGFAFDAENKKMYYIDTLFSGIYQFDYDGESGEIGNRKIIFKFEDHVLPGLPDGLTIDKEGNLWLAVIHGSAILKIDPKTGSLLKKIDMPTPEVTSLTWGNQNLDVMYATTAKLPKDGVVPPYPAGCTFKLERVGKHLGLADHRYKI